MAWAAIAIAVVGLLVSIGALRYTHLEAKNRKVEIDLLRRQVEGADSDRRAQRQADLAIVLGGASWFAGGGERELTVVNGGPAAARRIRVAPVDADTAGVGEGFELPVLPPHERVTRTIRTVRADDAVGAEHREPWGVWVEWEDGTGRHEFLETLPARP